MNKTKTFIQKIVKEICDEKTCKIKKENENEKDKKIEELIKNQEEIKAK